MATDASTRPSNRTFRSPTPNRTRTVSSRSTLSLRGIRNARALLPLFPFSRGRSLRFGPTTLWKRRILGRAHDQGPGAWNVVRHANHLGSCMRVRKYDFDVWKHGRWAYDASRDVSLSVLFVHHLCMAVFVSVSNPTELPRSKETHPYLWVGTARWTFSERRGIS